MRDHAIPASDVAYEIQLDVAHKKLLYPKIVFFSITHAVVMVLLKMKFNVTTFQGFVAMMATFLGTMCMKQIIFNAIARNIADTALNSGAGLEQ